MPEQFGDKQHEATPFRRQKAREQGEIPRSHDLASAIVLIGAVSTLLYFGSESAHGLVHFTQRQFAEVTWLNADRDSLVAQWHAIIQQTGKPLLPVFGSILLLAVAVQLLQTGFLFLPQKLAFDPNRINPLKGLQRILSPTNAVRLCFGIFKILLVIAVAFWCLWGDREKIFALSELDPLEMSAYVIQLTLWTCLKIGLALLLLAILDYGYQRWKHETDLRMTTQEVREELKSLQGDPQIAARRRAVQRQLVLNRIGTGVPKADVVITNPTELAVAIQYEMENMEAPTVVAKGAGSMAQRIRRIALEHGIPIVERKELARLLYKRVDVGRPIPPEQYAAMAEVLRYVYQLKGKTLPTARAS